MQLLLSRDEKELMENVHAILFLLRTTMPCEHHIAHTPRPATPSGSLPRRTGTCIFLCESRETRVHSQCGFWGREPGRFRF